MPQRPAANIDVYVDGVLGGTEWQLVSTGESAGADRLDIATLEYAGAVLEDFNALAPAWLGTEIEVVRNQTGAVWHWGKITQIPTVISSGSGETLRFVSRTEPFHLGARVDGYYIWNPLTAAATLIDGDVVFNPMIDGKIYGNRNDTKLSGLGGYLFLDPESVRTSAAQTLQGANIASWSLASAVHYLLWALNASQTNIANLSAAALSAVFNDPTVLVQDVRIPRGVYLTEALDMLIVPLGYHWRVTRTALGARQFDFWKRGTGGNLVSVYHQRKGAVLATPRDLSQTDVDTASVTFDASRLANEITVRGGFGEYEITAELNRAWATASDPASGGSGDEYAIDDDDFDTVRNVLRKWVLNEAGDYIGLRAEITGIFPTALRTSLSGLSLLNHFVPRRRELLPTLTVDSDGTPVGRVQGVEVEYSNTSPDDWKPIGNWGCQLLDHEAGVYFNGERVPEEFFVDVPNLKIRVTATIQSDYRLTGYAARQGTSPQPDVAPLVLDLPDRFRYRLRHSALSKYGGGATPSLAVDDTTAITDFSGFCRTAWDLMDVGGAIQIDGLDNAYTVGDRVQNISGKNISFVAKSGTSAYPQIVAVERNVNQQLTILHLQRYRDPLPLPPAPRGDTPRFRPRSTARDVL